jgi:hypothetical protein
MPILTRKIRYSLWVLNGYFGRKLSMDTPQKVTVLITYYHPARMKNIEPQIRNILRCTFVDRVIVSNHNPDIKIEERVNIKDERLIFINQNVRRDCGNRWRIAGTFHSEYLIAIDDDIFLFPSQLRKLFKHLIRAPEIPHGFSGMSRVENDNFQYYERKNMDVHYLCEVYAVTRQHVERYFQIEELLAAQDASFAEKVERYGDFIVISQTGSHNPKIHKVGRIFRNQTFKTPGVANHRDDEFGATILEVSQALERLQKLYLTYKTETRSA